MPPAFITGKTVYLRALERADAPVIVPWVNDPRVIEYVSIHKPMNLAAEESYIDAVNRSEHDVVFGVCSRVSDALIGVASLHQVDEHNRQAMFGIFVGDARNRGKGYGTETTVLVARYAFEMLNLNRVWLYVFEFNKRAIRVYEKVGFEKEGVLRQAHFSRGRYWNTVVMGLLRGNAKKLARRWRAII
jgi:UDP-4-amino-4,6-dideoxy-N-acetyl-beta-L-altrosamine N-acetyltransferase